MSYTERYICIHGHFYQPPRENPWLEGIELQDSAYPYHDWNERVAAESYIPNATARILDDQGRIVRIVNNYARISFDFGPTLLSWLEDKDPTTYAAILVADRESQKLFSGHGSAIAQAYNHVILPLANVRDKYTQIYWGIRDFEHRFGRNPEGMWLPEAAVDLQTLDILASMGIQFAILSPHQAWRMRRIGDEQDWQDVIGGRIDPTRAYQQTMPSGRKIALFFYDGPVSQSVAFDRLLSSGDRLVQRLVGAFNDARTWPQLVHIATDGETYGHHYRHGEMALAYALSFVESQKLARLANYGEFLEKFPPTHEVRIIENTSWSCFHGIGRWWTNCGCNSGGHPGWTQTWREPLREALNWLRDRVSIPFASQAAQLLKDPWVARNDYISVILDRSMDNIEHFIEQHAAHNLSEPEKVTVLKLMELQRHAMLMFTSCGWFFDDLSGIESVQVIQYAGRVIQLAREVLGEDLEELFLKRLELAKSNLVEYGNGAHIYWKAVKPAMLDLQSVAAHYAVSSLFTPQSNTQIYCYAVDADDKWVLESGHSKLIVGRARITSKITYESVNLDFGMLHFGDHNITGGVREVQDEEAYQLMLKEVTEAFERADLPEVIRLLDRHFLELTYSMKSLFWDEQRHILNVILEATLTDAGTAYRQIYEQHAPMMRFLTDLGIPLPKVLNASAEFVLNTQLREAFGVEGLDQKRVQLLLHAARREGVPLDIPGLSFALQKTLERAAGRFRLRPADFVLLQRLELLVGILQGLPFAVTLSNVQNAYYEILQAVYPEFLKAAERGDKGAETWISHFSALGVKLMVKVTE